jgi:hypothetical protein
LIVRGWGFGGMPLPRLIDVSALPEMICVLVPFRRGFFQYRELIL